MADSDLDFLVEMYLDVKGHKLELQQHFMQH